MRSLGVAMLLVGVVGACTSNGAPPTAPTGTAAPVTTVTLETRQGESGDSGPGSTTSTTTDPPVVSTSTPVPPSPAPASDGGADFYSCNGDADCVAVPKVACCPTGHLEAVNKQSATAYQNSFVCEMKRRVCPMYRVLDKRRPVCGTTSHKCELL